MSSLGTPVSIGAADAARLLSMKELIEALRTAFINGCTVPERHHHTIPVPGEEDATLLLIVDFHAEVSRDFHRELSHF